jgi:UDP-N-acetylmuramoylalanine--D-glutamate ligase
MNKYKDQIVAVIGFGIEGKDAIKYLLEAGALVTLFDKKEESELDFSDVDKTKIKLVCGENYLNDGIVDFDYIVRSPGVYPYTRELVDAKNSGSLITSAVKIFFDECQGKIIGVTGTKGKGTTSTLIYEILKADGRDVYLSGNIGKPYLELLPKLNENSLVVMEMSSFQLIDMRVSPHISVVLNITEDHMDWHKDREEYLDAKRNIVRFQKQNDFAVINEEYETPKSFATNTIGQVIFFSKQKLEQKYKEELLLRGEHNLENIAAAVATVKCIGISNDKILKTVQSFKGLEHRLELAGEINGVKFYNDSFATGPQPTIAAINSFTEPETIILGGSDKGLDYKELGEVISKKENIKHIILIGETKLKIENSLNIANCKLEIIKLEKTDMTKIVKIAHQITEPGGVVILSPASASFDMFKNYKDRGNQFKEAVVSLKQ